MKFLWDERSGSTAYVLNSMWFPVRQNKLYLSAVALLDAQKYFLSRLNQGALKFCFVFLLQRSVEYPCVSVAALRFKISTSSVLLPTSNGMQAASNAPIAILIWTRLVRVLCETERPTASVITLGKKPSLLLRNQDASVARPSDQRSLMIKTHPICPSVEAINNCMILCYS